LTQREEEDLKAWAIRRLRAVPVNISCAAGPSGASINGLYVLTDHEICGGGPVYCKKDDNEKLLEYIVSTNEWFV
jgi:hypothetical protein